MKANSQIPKDPNTQAWPVMNTKLSLTAELQRERAKLISRRWFLQQCGVGLGSMALASLLGADKALGATKPPTAPAPPGVDADRGDTVRPAEHGCMGPVWSWQRSAEPARLCRAQFRRRTQRRRGALRQRLFADRLSRRALSQERRPGAVPLQSRRH